jgi:hypothetical protein
LPLTIATVNGQKGITFFKVRSVESNLSRSIKQELELLTNSFAFQAFGTREYIKASCVMPPKLGTFWRFGTDTVVINLPYETHRTTTALGHILILNPEGDSKNFAIIIGGLSNYLDHVWIVLPLTIQQLEVAEPLDILRCCVELNYDYVSPSKKHVKSVLVSFGIRSGQLFR